MCVCVCARMHIWSVLRDVLEILAFLGTGVALIARLSMCVCVCVFMHIWSVLRDVLEGLAILGVGVDLRAGLCFS